MAKTYDAFAVEKYQFQGKWRKRLHKVGRMIPSKSGEEFNIYIPSGIAVSGHLFIAPDGRSDDELLEAYNSCAEEYGL